MHFPNTVLEKLPASVIERLGPRLRKHSLILGQVLFGPPDKINEVIFPASGAICLGAQLTSGEMVASALVGRGTILGGGAALDNPHAMYRSLVQVSGEAYVVDVATAHRVAAESAEFCNALAHHEQLILGQAQQAAACIAKHTLHQRLARALLHLRDVTGEHEFPLTQEFIAEFLGVRRTSVTVTAKFFQKEDMIKYRRGRISIQWPELLQQTACECYLAIKQLYARDRI